MVIFIINAQLRIIAEPRTITVLGTGYVGLITGACFAEFGHTVICADTDAAKIDSLHQNIMPIYEPGLAELVARNVDAQRLFFTTAIDKAIEQSDCIFIAVGTPMGADGCADLSALNKAFSMIASHLNSHKIICVKSTVPIGTGSKLLNLLEEQGADPAVYDVVSNPEFLREGSAIYDFMNPDRIVIGAYSQRARDCMKDLYETLIIQGVPCLFTSIASSETIKYASNAFLATKLSFVNEISNLCDQTGADIVDVAFGMGLDKRIGPAFLRPGPGFGGSCFPKDCHALFNMGNMYGVSLNLVSAALQTNEEQKKLPFKKLSKLMDYELTGKTIAVLGLAFKNNTDDVRYSPAITTIELLLAQGALIKAYDPAAIETMRKVFPHIQYCYSPYEAIEGAHGIVIMTEWDEFKSIDIARVSELVKTRILVDARNLLDPLELRKYDFVYAMMGRP